jgi:hypothetical protein
MPRAVVPPTSPPGLGVSCWPCACSRDPATWGYGEADRGAERAGVVDVVHRGEIAGVERIVAFLHEREQVRGPAGVVGWASHGTRLPSGGASRHRIKDAIARPGGSNSVPTWMSDFRSCLLPGAEQHHQQADFPSVTSCSTIDLHGHFVTIGILAIQVLTERPRLFTARNQAAISSFLPQHVHEPDGRHGR